MAQKNKEKVGLRFLFYAYFFFYTLSCLPYCANSGSTIVNVKEFVCIKISFLSKREKVTNTNSGLFVLAISIN